MPITLYNSFDEYRNQYQTLLPAPLHKGFLVVRDKVHGFARILIKIIEYPEVIRRVVQLIITIFSIFIAQNAVLDFAKLISKETKGITDLFRRFRSVAFLLKLKPNLRETIITFSGLTMFMVSAFALVDKLQIVNTSSIKDRLAAIPRLGSLPYGGILSIAILVMTSMLFWKAIDKRKNLATAEECLREGKYSFWSQPFDVSKVKAMQTKYVEKRQALQTEMTHGQQLLDDGKKIATPDSATTKAIVELSKQLDALQLRDKKYEQKAKVWKHIEDNFAAVSGNQLEAYRAAKQRKYETCLRKIKIKKIHKILSIFNNFTIASRQFLTLAGAITQAGSLPPAVNTLYEIAESSFSIALFVLKKVVQNIPTPSADLFNYFPEKKTA